MTTHHRIGAIVSSGLCFFILITGCAHNQKNSSKELSSPKHNYTSNLILETKAEAEKLRSQLATERIQAAKQQAEIQAARREVVKLREREAEFVQKMAQTKEELSSVRVEVHKLRRENAELQGKTAGLPQLLQVITEIRNMQSSLTGMVSTFKDLTSELASVKGDLRKHQRRTGWAPDHITVQKDDTLWSLAHTYGTTVKDLQTINNIQGSMIFPGQQLRLKHPKTKERTTALSPEVSGKPPMEASHNPRLSPTATSKKSP